MTPGCSGNRKNIGNASVCKSTRLRQQLLAYGSACVILMDNFCVGCYIKLLILVSQLNSIVCNAVL